jgi:DNA-binding protein H-NS
MATLTSLKKQIAALEARVARVAKAELDEAIAKVRKLMVDHGVTIEHLVDTGKSVRAKVLSKGGSKAPATKGPRAAKYADPKSGATWSGFGRAPAWLAKAKDRSAFLIGKTTSDHSKALSKEGSKAPATKGSRPAKYADPKSGATWSGFGPAPAWLAKAKDRSAFLIGKTVADDAQPKATAKKTPPPRAESKSTRATGKAALGKAVATRKGAPAKKATPVTKSGATKKAAKAKPVVAAPTAKAIKAAPVSKAPATKPRKAATPKQAATAAAEPAEAPATIAA